jgi:cysteine desulfurase / selenocysteine lyase
MTAVKQTSNFDIHKIREDFPILSRKVNGKPLVYLDNGGSSQSPASVIARFDKYHAEEHSNVHRGVHYLSQLATNEYEKARVKVQKFINARESKECIFVRGCTEGVNLVAQSYGRANFVEGDEIILSQMEHHANIIPWQMIAEEKGAKIRVIPMNERGELIIDEYENLFNERTKFVSIIHVSNALGTINPVKSMIETAHKFGVPVMVDAAQSIPHMQIDVQDLDCDFLTFSGHKMFALRAAACFTARKNCSKKCRRIKQAVR